VALNRKNEGIDTDTSFRLRLWTDSRVIINLNSNTLENSKARPILSIDKKPKE
jgi:hypothetical protein